jgi:hypothetical protein
MLYIAVLFYSGRGQVRLGSGFRGGERKECGLEEITSFDDFLTTFDDFPTTFVAGRNPLRVGISFSIKDLRVVSSAE